MRPQKRHSWCWESIQYNFSRIINMKIEFGSQRRQMLDAVTSSADQQYWQLAISRNWQIEKMGDWARIRQRFGKNSNEVTKRGNLANGDYKKMANLGENGKFRQKWRVQEFGQIQMRWQKGASWQMTIL